MPTMSRICFYLSLSVAAAASVSCKLKKTDGTVKTLENLAAGNQDKQNQCSGEFASTADTFDASIDVSAVVDPKDRSAMKARVKSALSAVPPGFQTAYFTYANGTVRVTPNAEEECRKLAKGSVAENFISCADDSNNKVILIVKAETGAIDHNIVRIMATLINGWSAVGEETGTKTEARKFAKDLGAYIRFWQLNLTSAFVADLRSMPKAAKTLKIFEDVLKENNANKKARLQDELFANMFDSVYCSDTTRKSLSKFPQTLNEIQRMINDPVIVTQDGAPRAAQISWSYLADTKKIPRLPPIEVKKGSGLNLGDDLNDPYKPARREINPTMEELGIQNWKYDQSQEEYRFFNRDGQSYTATRNGGKYGNQIEVYPSARETTTMEERNALRNATMDVRVSGFFGKSTPVRMKTGKTGEVIEGEFEFPSPSRDPFPGGGSGNGEAG